MGEISLKGKFIFSGTGELKRNVRRIKVLKQLNSDFFICGDRPIPEKIYTIPLGKKVVYARIDNNGDNLDDWTVAIFLKPIEFEYDEAIDYNQQKKRDGTEDIVYLDSTGVVKTFPLKAEVNSFNNNKIYTGNHSLYQVDVGDIVTVKVNEGGPAITEQIYDLTTYQERRNTYKISIFDRSTLSNPLSGLKKVVENNSTGEDRQFYKDPYHKTKGLYHVRKFYPRGFPDVFGLHEFQTYTLKETTESNSEVFVDPPEDDEGDGRRGNRNGDKTREFVDRCGVPGDAVVFLLAKEGEWMRGVASGISWYRGWPSSGCQFKAPPYPTFQASCSVIRETEPREVWCPTWIGSGYYAPFVIGNFEFKQTPPFGGRLIDSTTGRASGIGAIFEPNPRDMGGGSLDAVGATLTSVQGRADVRLIGIPRMIDVSSTEDPVAQAFFAEFNALRQEIFDEAYARLSARPELLDMGLFTPEGKRKTSCDYPYPENDDGDNDRGDRDGPGPQFKRKGDDDEDKFIIEEYFIKRDIIGLFSLPFKYLRISLTNNDYEDINEEIFNILNQEHGLTVNPNTYDFFVIDLKQPFLNNDISVTKNNETEWEVDNYVFSLFELEELNESTNSTWEITKIKEKVFPLKDFDKIWSYSYYA